MSHTDDLVGRKIANYQIERLLGRGGMASVYYGIDVQLQRPVAIKVIADRYRGDPIYAERFVLEARAMAAWRHPNIPHIYYAGVEAGYSFYALEYIHGLDLEQLMRQVTRQGHLLPYKDILLIGRAVAAALDYAHQKGAVHRDVKPANVLISDDDRILLTDFGLVLVLDKGTRGEVFGSPHYMAPEQARSSAAAVPQSDLYALGVILYELLVGRVPFDDPSPASLALKHLTLEPPAPRQLNPDLSPDIEAVLLKALSKQPGDRYQTGQALLAALDAAIAPLSDNGVSPQSLTAPLATLLDLPASLGDQPPRTLSRLSAPEFNPGPAGQDQPPLHGLPELSRVSAAQMRPARRSVSRTWHVPAVILAAAGLLIVGCAVVVLPRWILGLSGARVTPATSTAATAPAAATARLTPSQPSATLTASPEPSMAAGSEFHIVIAVEKGDSLFLINRGPLNLPLTPIRFEGGQGQLSGEEWQVEVLRPGQCVTVWKEEGNPRAPDEVECETRGERLERSGGEKFWDADFEVYYGDYLVGRCEEDTASCDLSFSSTP